VGLSDVGGVFSRYFIVGFFLPAFFTMAGIKIAASQTLLPSVVEANNATAFLVVGGTAVLVGYLLVGLNFQIVRVFEGYPLMEPDLDRSRKRCLGRAVASILVWLRDALRGRELARFERLHNTKTETDMKLKAGKALTREEQLARMLAYWRLDIWFPPHKNEVLPTRLGNRIRAFESYSGLRWGLDSIAAWSRIQPLLSDTEQTIYSDKESEMLFFLNGSIGAYVATVILAIDGAVNQPHPLWLAWIYLLPLLFGYLLYLGSTSAAQRWGDVVCAAFDIHRLELYQKLGLRPATSFEEEQEMAAAVTSLLLWGVMLPDKYKAG
jgi:hypothetical protein